ncbi:MAG: hypothetical protein ABR555_11415 [Pyrinomonadaceae bacterium]
MSDEKTTEIENSKSFEERVFARFDAIDYRFDRVEGRLGAVEIRITKLEDRQYDTKPIWEQALAAIAELRAEMSTSLSDLRSEMNTSIGELRSEMNTSIGELRSEMKDGFAGAQMDLKNAVRGVERKMDVLNQNFLNMQAEQRYLDGRIEELQSQSKSS